MKRLVFAITLIALLCSCNNGAQKKSSSDDNGKREYAIERLKDSTINAVYLGLHMGDSKENVLAHMKELQLNNRIRKFQPCPIMMILIIAVVIFIIPRILMSSKQI